MYREGDLSISLVMPRVNEASESTTLYRSAAVFFCPSCRVSIWAFVCTSGGRLINRFLIVSLLLGGVCWIDDGNKSGYKRVGWIIDRGEFLRFVSAFSFNWVDRIYRNDVGNIAKSFVEYSYTFFKVLHFFFSSGFIFKMHDE